MLPIWTILSVLNEIFMIHKETAYSILSTSVIRTCSILTCDYYLCVSHSKKKLCALYGKWTECMYIVDPAAFEAHKRNDKQVAEEKKGSKPVCILIYSRL